MVLEIVRRGTAWSAEPAGGMVLASVRRPSTRGGEAYCPPDALLPTGPCHERFCPDMRHPPRCSWAFDCSVEGICNSQLCGGAWCGIVARCDTDWCAIAGCVTNVAGWSMCAGDLCFLAGCGGVACFAAACGADACGGAACGVAGCVEAVCGLINLCTTEACAVDNCWIDILGGAAVVSSCDVQIGGLCLWNW